MTEHNTKRPLILALVFSFISILGAVVILLSLLPQIMSLVTTQPGIPLLGFLIIVGIGLVVLLSVRFFYLAEQTSIDLDDE
jgi:hypothetical protein